MDKVKERLLHLDYCRGVGWKTKYRLLQADPELSNLYRWTERDLKEMTNLQQPSIEKFIKDLHSEKVITQIDQLSKENIHPIALFDKEYPAKLREIFEPPWFLYAKGDKSFLQHKKMLAVVGSRQMTTYGKHAIDLLFPGLIAQDVTIVSGLAKGIDTKAHEMAIRLGGQTVAVIAGGFDYIYPQENMDLAKKIYDNHLVVTEYPPHTRPTRWQFPLRNRIISGVCDGTLVIEANRRSGSFITADYALNEGREVFAVPGNISNPYAKGTNNLIQKGAKLVTRAEDILSEIVHFHS